MILIFNFMEIFGWLGMIIVSIQFLPQLFKTLKTKKAEDLSWFMLFLVFLGSISWTIHGFLILDYPIIFTNIILFFISLSLIFLKLKYKNDF